MRGYVIIFTEFDYRVFFCTSTESNRCWLVFFLIGGFYRFFGNIYVRKRGFSFDEASWILFSKSISRTDFGHFLRIFLLGCKREGSRLGSAFALRNSVRFLFSFFLIVVVVSFRPRERKKERKKTNKQKPNRMPTGRVIGKANRIETRLATDVVVVVVVAFDWMTYSFSHWRS